MAGVAPSPVATVYSKHKTTGLVRLKGGCWTRIHEDNVPNPVEVALVSVVTEEFVTMVTELSTALTTEEGAACNAPDAVTRNK